MAANSTRLRILAIGSVVVLAVLAGAADRSAGGGRPIPIPGALFLVAAQTLLWLVIATAVIILGLIIYATVTDHSSMVAEPLRKRSMLTYLLALVPTLIALALLYLRRPGGGTAFRGPFGIGALPPPVSSGQANTLQGADTIWLSLVLAALLAGIFLMWLFWPARRQARPRRTSAVQTEKEPMVEAVDEGIDALHAIADPRQAIIAAYTSMEASLVHAGVPRRRSDTPFEFLSRALAAVVGISTDAGRLTYLFEFARFSPHDVDTSMRADALGALQKIRARLTATAAT
ncbi:MAG TPA: DUF4129 domain-containing protein [Candidatus Dormibacteraeota bacterium]|nr:DUF4129 domain-containing protein [Candidatus Dormibacteraeota bacterium]